MSEDSTDVGSAALSPLWQRDLSNVFPVDANVVSMVPVVPHGISHASTDRGADLPLGMRTLTDVSIEVGMLSRRITV